jgi:hypothetical protein
MVTADRRVRKAKRAHAVGGPCRVNSVGTALRAFAHPTIPYKWTMRGITSVANSCSERSASVSVILPKKR